MTDPFTNLKATVAKIDALIEDHADYFSGWHEAHLGEPSTHGKWKARALAAEAEVEKLLATLQEFAKQKRTDELDAAEIKHVDFEGAYDAFIDKSRKALEAEAKDAAK